MLDTQYRLIGMTYGEGPASGRPDPLTLAIPLEELLRDSHLTLVR